MAAEKTPLTKEQLVDAAYKLIDENGPDAFSMRALGRELDISAMACYLHFPSKEALLAAVVEKHMKSLDTHTIPGERWDDSLRRTTWALRQARKEHPNISQLIVRYGTLNAGLADHDRRVISMHLSQGMPEEILKQAWPMVDAFLSGFAANDKYQAAHPRNESGQRNAFESGFHDDRWVEVIANAYTDESFKNGVEFIIKGIERLAAPDPCEWYTPKR